MQPNTRLVLWIGACVIALPFLPFILVPLWNNARMARLQSNFSLFVHPPQTQKLHSWRALENFGNGNHLDFYVAELRQKTASLQLGAFYRGKTVAVPFPDETFESVKNGRQPIEFEALPSPLPAGFVYNRGSQRSADFSRFAGQKNLYVVSIWNSGEDLDVSGVFDGRAW